MKVIAKYLPIKGDIKRGDMVTDLQIKGKVIKAKGYMCDVKESGGATYSMPKENLIRLKFFAVTYEEIKKDDPVVIATTKQTFLKKVHQVSRDGYYLIDERSEETEFYQTKYVFKVLGEIRGNYGWVNEEQEIDIEIKNDLVHIKCPHCETFI